jgi:hypothetical protein
MSNYQLTIDGDNVSQPMDKDEAAAWLGLLRITFPGATILASLITCLDCGEPLPDMGPCWHNLFGFEEVEPRPTLAEMLAASNE